MSITVTIDYEPNEEGTVEAVTLMFGPVQEFIPEPPPDPGEEAPEDEETPILKVFKDAS